MPKVPVLEPTVGYGTRTAAAPVTLRPPAAAFGGDVAEATSGLGKQVQRTGDVAFQHVLQLQQRADEQDVLDTQTRFQQDLQSRLINPEPDDDGVPKGFLSRQLNQSKGSTVQFDTTAEELKKLYMEAVPGETQKERMNQILSAHLTNAREQVIQHEARQGQVAFMDSFKANQSTTIQNAAGISDPDGVNRAIRAAQLAAVPAYHHLGMSGEQTIAQNQELAGQIVESALTPLLERDPKAAQAVLNANKGEMSPLVAAKMQNTIDGKIIHDQQASAWNAVSGMRLSTGEVDLAAAHQYVDKLTLPQERKDQILSYVRTRASIADAELKQRQEAIKRSYTDQLVSDYGKVSVDVAHARAAMTGLPPTMIAELQNEATTLYQQPELRFSTWESKQPQSVVAAIESSKQDITNAYPSKKNLRDGAITELENQWIGKTPAQIRQITADALKDVKSGHFAWWDTHETSWRMDAANRAAEDLRLGQLEKDFPEAYLKAKAKVASDGVPLIYENIKAVMDKLQKGNQ